MRRASDGTAVPSNRPVEERGGCENTDRCGPNCHARPHLRSNNHSLRYLGARLIITKRNEQGQPSPATVLRLLCVHDRDAAVLDG